MCRRHFVVLGAALLATTASVAQDVRPSTTGLIGKARYGEWGVALDARDTATKPGDDFFRYANGAWYDRAPIPADRPVVGVNTVLADEVELQVRAIAEDAAKLDDPAAKQVADFWASWMNETEIEARGSSTLRPYLDKAAAVRTRDDLLRLFTEPGYTAPIQFSIRPDPSRPSRYIAYASQGGLGLPNRDYYLREGEKFEAIRTSYRDYVVRVQTLASISNPDAKADAIIALETTLAKSHWTPERSRDIKQIYNPMTREQLTDLAPEFEWMTLLQRQGLENVDTVVVTQPSAISDAGKMLTSVPLSTWKDYSAYHFLRAHAQYLPKTFDQAHFNFFSKILRDVPEPRDRWKRGVVLLNSSLGEAVGELYVQRHYPAESSRLMNQLIGDLGSSFAERLARVDWMDDATRREALAKLDAFEARIGHPVKYIDYSPIKVDRGDLLGNVIRANDFAWDLRVSRLGGPVDRTLWAMTPQTINATYAPLMNQITFAAAILQPPFFDPKADAAVNYGGIGAGIGHEIGHGFDDQGRRFDGTGRIRDWWTEESAKKFSEKATRLGGQYSQFEPIPGINVNGQLTMGENIGDLGGLEMAYAAYRRHLTRIGGSAPVLNGLTGDQRFFLAWAQVWRQKLREGQLRQQLLTDPHSPAEFRVNGVVRNVDAWYVAFDVKPGDKLYLPPEERVRIW
jgi:endothelin-converting enzyme/putative endopeptidase